MTKSLRSLRQLVCIVVLIFSMPACAATYRGAPISGRVVDAETKRPVKGAVVVIEWQLYGGLHPDILGRLLLQETVTDEQGRYGFPAWGPLRAPEGEIDRAAPKLNFYKRGYKFTTHSNYSYEPPYVKLPDPLISEWEGKTIELVPYDSHSRREDRWQELPGASGLFSFAYEGEPCAWQQIPHMTAELVKREMEYRRNGASASLPDLQRLHRTGKCADPTLLLRDYLHE